MQRLMRLMGLESTAPKPNTSKPAPEHAVYPYLLRNLTVSRVNQVWAADITYIRTSLPGGDHRPTPGACPTRWRRASAWRPCTNPWTATVAQDQGSQFTSEDFTDVLLERGIKIQHGWQGRQRQLRRAAPLAEARRSTSPSTRASGSVTLATSASGRGCGYQTPASHDGLPAARQTSPKRLNKIPRVSNPAGSTSRPHLGLKNGVAQLPPEASGQLR